MNETELGRMVVRLMGDGSNYQAMLKSAGTATSSFASGMGSAFSFVGSTLMAFGRMLAGWAANAISALTKVAAVMAAAGATAAVAFVKWGIDLAGEAEQAQISFEVMLGSAAKAAKMVKDIQRFAAETPMDTAGITSAAKTLLQFGVAGDQIMGTLKAIGDAAGGDNARFQHMALAFGQMSAAGRLMGQDLLQMINAGFNPLKEISRTTGKSMLTLKTEMEAGKISTEMVANAFRTATSAGGAFNGMMERQSQTLVGLRSTLMDNLAAVARIAGQEIVDMFGMKASLQRNIAFLGTFADNFKENIRIAKEYAVAKWAEFSTWFMTTFGGILSYAQAVWTYISTAVSTFVLNAIGFFAHFGENIGKIWAWLGRNTENILTDILNLYFTYYGNMVHNTGVALETMVKLWMNFSGFFHGMITGLFGFKFMDAVLTGLIAVGEKIREWAFAVWDEIQSIFTGEGGGAFQGFLDMADNEFQKGMDDGDLFKTMGNTLKEGFAKMKGPVEGFKSSLEDMPEMNLKLGGVPLPQFVWKEGQKAGEDFSKGFGTGMGDMTKVAQEATKVTDAVQVGTTEALARMQEFRGMREAAASAMNPAGQKPADTPKEKQVAVLENINKGIDTLVELQRGQAMAGEPLLELEPAGIV